MCAKFSAWLCASRRRGSALAATDKGTNVHAFGQVHVCHMPCRAYAAALAVSWSAPTACERVPPCAFAASTCRYLSLPEAQSKALKVDWSDPVNKPVQPKLLGTKVRAALVGLIKRARVRACGETAVLQSERLGSEVGSVQACMIKGAFMHAPNELSRSQ